MNPTLAFSVGNSYGFISSMMEHPCNPLLFPEYGTDSDTNPTFSTDGSNEKGLGEEVYGGVLVLQALDEITKKKKNIQGWPTKKQFLLQVFDGCSKRVQAQFYWIHAITVLSSDRESDEGCYSQWYLLDNQWW